MTGPLGLSSSSALMYLHIATLLVLCGLRFKSFIRYSHAIFFFFYSLGLIPQICLSATLFCQSVCLPASMCVSHFTADTWSAWQWWCTHTYSQSLQQAGCVWESGDRRLNAEFVSLSLFWPVHLRLGFGQSHTSRVQFDMKLLLGCD